MKKLALLFGLLFAFPAIAADNAVIVTPGVGVTMKSKDIGAGVQAMQPVLSDTSGNALSTPTAGADGVSNTSTGLLGYTRGLVFNGTTWDRWYGDLTNGAFVNVKTSALPTGAGTSANQTTINTSIGTTNTNLGPPGATACATDTSSCSVNALLQRVAQNLSTLNTTAGAAATLTAAAVGGASTTGNIAANNTTAVVIKASAGTLYGVQLYGIGSAPAYLKIYNATSATCGSGTPVKRLMIPAAATAANGAGSNISFGDIGVAFGTGITYCVTTGIGDADATAPAASTFLVNLDWK